MFFRKITFFSVTGRDFGLIGDVGTVGADGTKKLGFATFIE